MNFQIAKRRFALLAEAYAAEGGFSPQISTAGEWVQIKKDDGTASQVWRNFYRLDGPCHLVQYPRESDEKYAARAAVSVYENHLLEAVDRFVGYLGRRPPMRSGLESPLLAAFAEDADGRGSNIDQMMREVSEQMRARGSALVLLDMPDVEPATSMQDQIARRVVPWARVIKPELLVAYEIDRDTGLFVSATLPERREVDGTVSDCEITYTATEWVVRLRGEVVKRGDHPFGACPVLPVTENNGLFPQVGSYAQIAGLSLRVFNANSELDEILRGQTFSLLTLQVPADAAHDFDPATTAATIGTHSMLVHRGITPAFVSPDSGPATVYMQRIERLEASIRRIAQDDATTVEGAQESGIARRQRFERLNSDLATFAKQLQGLERRIWAMVARALNTPSTRVSVTYPTDFNMVDTMAELGVLQEMQAAGMPEVVLSEKRAQVVGSEFDALDGDTKARLVSAAREKAQETPPVSAPGGAP